jgi:2-polyprenyl-3-methyl-5-hydroxy-6-metoxy-1,4-benzoquinol methylase
MKITKLFNKIYKIKTPQENLASNKNDDWNIIKISEDKSLNNKVDPYIYSIVAFSGDGTKVLKVEINKHPRKLNCLNNEVKTIKFLNSKNCISAPNILFEATLIDQVDISKKDFQLSYNCMILERLASDGGYTISDVIISLLEQKSLGVYHGDVKPDNICFNGNTGICHFIDYDQSEYISKKEMDFNSEDFLNWCNKKELEKYGFRSWIRHFQGLNYNRHIHWLLKAGAFNIATTTPYKKQVTTNTKNGVYHTIKSHIIFAEGVRDFESRINLLDMVKFKENEKVLDVGCNAGLLTHYLYNRGCEVVGMEMDSWLVNSAKMISNIFRYNIKYIAADMDKIDVLDSYNTVCLFSVIHHTKNLKMNGLKVAGSCDRILLECRLSENGHKPILDDKGKSKWIRSSVWNYSNEDELVRGMENLFPNFRLLKILGKADKGRLLLELVKE